MLPVSYGTIQITVQTKTRQRIFVCLLVYVVEGVCVYHIVWRPEDRLQKSVLSFHHVDYRIKLSLSGLVAPKQSYNQ